MWSRETVRITGSDDETESLASLVGRVADTADSVSRFLVALPAGVDPTAVTSPAAALGTVGVGLPTTDNTNHAQLALIVREDLRRRGIGTALHEAAVQLARREHRRSILTYVDAAGEAAPGTDGIAARSGTGVIDGALASSVFARSLGYELEQVERCSRLALPVPDEVLGLEIDALAKAGSDYELIEYTDACPEDLLEPYARLRIGMSVDIPAAGLDYSDEIWTPDRIRREEARLMSTGRHALVVLARHRPSGDLAGYTALVRETVRPHVVAQWDTYVTAAHRGHSLGLAMKAANLRRAAANWPDAAHVSTWNAEENEHMLAINTALGFRPFSVSAAWQLRLPDLE